MRKKTIGFHVFMLIGIDASRANHEEKTGVEWYAWHIIEEWKKVKNEDIQFILYSDEPLKGELARLPQGWSSKVLRWPPKRLWTQVRLSLEMFFHPPDVLFIPAHVAPIIHPKKTVMVVHDVAAAHFPEAYNRFERWYSLVSAKSAVRHLAGVIVPSEFTKREVAQLFYSHTDEELLQVQKICVVPHGYDTAFHPNHAPALTEEICATYGIRRPYILTIGRLEIKKNIERILAAFSEICADQAVSPHQLVLAGKPGYGYAKIRALLAKHPYRNQIVMTGWLPQSESIILMREAVCVLFPSLYEGFGMPVLEAMACGTPVITGRGSSLEEVGGDAAQYVDPLDVSSIANGVKTLIQHASLRKKKSEDGVLHVQQFSWARSAQETLKILRRV